MRREDLEERLDTEVTVTLFDGSEYTGVLRQCGTDYVRDNDNLFLVGVSITGVQMDDLTLFDWEAQKPLETEAPFTVTGDEYLDQITPQ